MQAYQAYGVGIKSEFTFGALPVCPATDASISFVVERKHAIHIVQEGVTKLCQSQGRNIYVRVLEQTLEVQIGSFARFIIFPSAGQISCECLEIVPDALLRYWVIQQVLPLYLLWNGTAEFLHGMAISTHASSEDSLSSSCISFLGDSHAGKSTLLSYFLSRHHSLVSDDHLALSRKNYAEVLPATPYYRPYRAGEDLGHVAERFSPEPVTLRCIYLLEPTFGYADIVMEDLTGIVAVAALLPHIQYNLHNAALPQLFPMIEERFTGLNHIVRKIPIRRLYVPRALDRLPEVYEFIQKNLVS